MSTQAIHHHLFDTAIGECGVAWNSRGLVGVQLPEKDRGQTELRLAVKCHSTGADDVPNAAEPDDQNPLDVAPEPPPKRQAVQAKSYGHPKAMVDVVEKIVGDLGQAHEAHEALHHTSA